MGEEVRLKNSTNFKDIFRIRNRNGKIVCIKKRTFVWILSTGFQKCSPDRTLRFQETVANDRKVKYANEILKDIAVGEFLLLKSKGDLVIYKVFGFKFLDGKSFSSTTVKITPRENDRKRGLTLLGSLFSIQRSDGDYILDLVDQFYSIKSECYVSHLDKPLVDDGILYYTKPTVIYIDSFE